MAENPTYLLAPNFTFKPGGPIALGNIVADPFRPHRVLTAVDAATLAKDYPRVERFVERESRLSHDASRDASLAVWAQFLNSVGVSASGERGSTTSFEYAMETLETHYFVEDPGHEKIVARVKTPRVQAVMKAGGFGRSPACLHGHRPQDRHRLLYHPEKGRHSSSAAEVSCAVPTPAGQVSVGANASGSREFKDRYESKGGEDLVFAYQLLKIELKGWKNKAVTYDEFRHKAAYLSTDDDDDDHYDESDGEDAAGGSDLEVNRHPGHGFGPARRRRGHCCQRRGHGRIQKSGLERHGV